MPRYVPCLFLFYFLIRPLLYIVWSCSLYLFLCSISFCVFMCISFLYVLCVFLPLSRLLSVILSHLVCTYRYVPFDVSLRCILNRLVVSLFYPFLHSYLWDGLLHFVFVCLFFPTSFSYWILMFSVSFCFVSKRSLLFVSNDLLFWRTFYSSKHKALHLPKMCYVFLSIKQKRK